MPHFAHRPPEQLLATPSAHCLHLAFGLLGEQDAGGVLVGAAMRLNGKR